MKLLITLTTSLIFLGPVHMFGTEERLYIAAATRAMTSNISVGKFLWELNDREIILMEMENYNIYEQVQYINLAIQTIFSNTSKQDVVYKENLLSIERSIKKIEYFYKDMLNYYKTHKSISFIAKNEMIKTLYNILQYRFEGPSNLITEIKDLLAYGSFNILDRLKEQSYNYANTCSTETSQKSLQATFHSYLRMIVLAEIKVYFILNIASNILYHYDVKNSINTYFNFNNMILDLSNNHEKILKKFKTVLPHIPKAVWRCDPDFNNYEEDVTYIKLKHVFVGHSRNQRSIQESSDYKCSESTCGSVNPTYDRRCMLRKTEEDNEKLPKPVVCQEQRKCSGFLWNCNEAFGLTKTDMKVCLSEKASDRSYDFVEFMSSVDYNHYGLKKSCARPIVHEFRKCTRVNCCFTCYCICDDQLDYNATKILSERMFYTKSVEADLMNNYVITGARLRKKQGVIYIQIQQGQLLENGLINKTTVHWKYEPLDSITNPSNHFKLHWKARSIQLGDVHIPPENVLIGFKFENETVNGIERIILIALSRTYDYASGKNGHHEREFFSSRASSTTGIEIHNLKLPEYLVSNNVIESSNYLSFSISNFESDLGQTTIPFIDIQDVTIKEPFPMSGVGLYYRRSDDSSIAGFLGLKLITYDISRHIPQNF